MSDNPDGPRRALIVSLARKDDDYVISLDDAIQTDGTAHWKQVAHVTSKSVPEDFLSLSEEELASFGYYILARLHAFREMDEL